MTNNRFFTLETEAKRQFIQIPKQFLIAASKYYKMSSDSKMLYGILLDRNSLSIKNGWVDKEKNIYFIATIENLMEITGWGNQKVTKHLKELRAFDLLFSKQRGQGKPSHHYLKEVEVEEGLETQLYQQKCDNHISRNVEFTSQEMLNSHANNTDLNNTDLNNTYSSSSSEENTSNEVEEEDYRNRDLKSLLEKVRVLDLHISKKDLERLLIAYTSTELIKCLVLIPSDAKSHIAYLKTILVNNAKRNINQITQVIEKNNSSTGTFNAAKENERGTVEEEVLDAFMSNDWE